MKRQDFDLEIEEENDAGAKLNRLCRSILEESFPAFRGMTIDARFYPYIGLTHTMRKKGSDSWEIRISDHCCRAPSRVIEAIVMILGNKVMHKRTPRKFLEVYERFRKEPLVLEAARERRLKKGRKQFAPHSGKHHELQEIYKEINHRYFNDQVDIGRIGWGLRKSRARLGHYDPIHHTVTLSPLLDSPEVPAFVLQFIVYHELLHSVFDGVRCHAVHVHHPPEFRMAERAYPHYEKARIFLKNYCRKNR